MRTVTRPQQQPSNSASAIYKLVPFTGPQEKFPAN